jgi:hypothetical protein
MLPPSKATDRAALMFPARCHIIGAHRGRDAFQPMERAVVHIVPCQLVRTRRPHPRTIPAVRQPQVELVGVQWPARDPYSRPLRPVRLRLGARRRLDATSRPLCRPRKMPAEVTLHSAQRTREVMLGDQPLVQRRQVRRASANALIEERCAKVDSWKTSN